MTGPMKSSGLYWMGDIPENWNMGSLIKYLRAPISDGPHETPNCVSDGIPFVSIDSLSDSADIDFSVVKKYISEEDYQRFAKKTVLEPGDILFTKSATIGKTAIVGEEKFMIWSPLAIIKPNYVLMDQKYLYYLLGYDEFVSYAKNLGGFNTQANVGMRDLEKAAIPVPPIEVQKKIGLHLDKKLSLISGIIDAQQQMISRLEELKQSTITDAVTKGLDPTVEMKDSGIEWIDMMPNSWDLCKLSRYTESNGGCTPSRNIPSYWTNGTINWMSSGEVNLKRIYDTEEKVTELALEETSLKLSPKNTVVVALNGQGKTKGKSAILMIPCTHNQSLASYICDEKHIHYRYLYMVFQSMYKYLRQNVGDDSRNGISIEFLNRVKIPLPSFEEQIKIADAIDIIDRKIESIISERNSVILKLNEMKQSLIYEYVTGKKQVSQEA